MNLNLLIFCIYLLIAGNTTYFLGRTLYTNGEVFLFSIFTGKHEMVKPLNKVLLIGFYLVNLGFVLLFISSHPDINTLLESIHVLSEKLAIVYLVLGAMHIFNIITFIYLEKRINNSNAKF